jgi:hydrogenase small subunit
MPTEAAVKAEETLIHVLWINAGLSCDGDSVALTAATQPSIEEIALGALPGLPKIAVHWPLIDFECGPTGGADDFLEWFFKADRGELEPFVLVVEGSIPNEAIKNEGYWCGFGNDPATGQAPMIPLDDALRPQWLFGNTVHEGCDRAGYYEQGDFATEYGSPKCIVKLGCWGPVVKCNVPKRGWINGIGGCPNVGGICIGCTMPGFPDKFMPFMDEPPGGKVSTTASGLYGSVIRSLRGVTNRTLDKEPRWRHKGDKLTTGAHRTW